MEYAPTLPTPTEIPALVEHATPFFAFLLPGKMQAGARNLQTDAPEASTVSSNGVLNDGLASNANLYPATQSPAETRAPTPILAQSALERLAHNAHQIVMECDSYRSRQRPGMAAPTPPRTMAFLRKEGRRRSSTRG